MVLLVHTSKEFILQFHTTFVNITKTRLISTDFTIVYQYNSVCLIKNLIEKLICINKTLEEYN